MVKRKGTDFLNTSVSSYVSVRASSYDDAMSTSWEETRAKMKAMRAKNVTSLLESLRRCDNLHEELQDSQTTLVSDAQHVKNELLARIELAREACKEESDDLYKMQLTLQKLQVDRDALLEALDDLESTMMDTNARIRSHQKECNQTIEIIDSVEAERMRAVPRLKQQLSLYASTTGIKWDYDERDELVGHLMVQKTGGIRNFRIDPKDYTDFQITNHLWSLIENGTYGDEGEKDNGSGNRAASE